MLSIVLHLSYVPVKAGVNQTASSYTVYTAYMYLLYCNCYWY